MDTSYKIEGDNLVIYCDADTQKELVELGDEIHSDKVMFDCFEHITCNGLSWVRPEDIGALTDAPILSENHQNDDGEYPRDAKFYWFGNYQVRAPLEDLRDHGKVIFTQS